MANHGQYPTIMHVLQQYFPWHRISALTEAKVFVMAISLQQ